MQYRITSPQGKVTYVVVGYVVALTAAVVGALAASPAVGVVVYSVVVVLLVWCGTRLFRGEGEDPNGTRPMWRMTARPTAGFVLAILLILQAASTAINAASAQRLAPLYVVAVVLSLGLAAAYLNSSLRLRRTT
ncbi:hypothetical protein [Leifsonia naganoensis]|uniref:Uncharacterized protein n=1 Tax=Leifsonia naganoensis TaxID=150025 RepID=A0A853DJA0_9MICO|nr:hypothetical protein [Leifsonia naganoensis]NYK08418.1 hypothetical protein [Leifsonia naganoensis]